MPEDAPHPDSIPGWITLGKRFVERGLASRDKIHAKKFLDGSPAAALLLDDDGEGEGVLPDGQESGNVNYLATNVLTKVASIAIGDPDWFVDCGEDPPIDPMQLAAMQMLGMPLPITKAELAQIARRALRDLWKRRGWARIGQKALLKRSISGMGFIAVLWHDTEGPVLQHVKACNLAVDPDVTDWRKLRKAAIQIKMPRADAQARWPDADFGTAAIGDIPNLDEPHPRSRDCVPIWLYWDQEKEVYVFGSTVLEEAENLYGRVPLYVLEGDIAPESEFSIGDYDTATQIQEMLARLIIVICNQAENEGAIGWHNPALLDEGSKDIFSNGRPSRSVPIMGSPEDAFGFASGAPMNPAVLECFRLMMQGLDSATGVSEYQRGVLSQQVKFATEAALLANQSGSRGNQARIQYELFLSEVGLAVVDLLVRFGPSLMNPLEPSDEDDLLLEALSEVKDLCVLENSTSYKDPAYEMQTSLQLLTAMMPFVEAGVVNPLPLITDVFRAFGKRDVNKYLAQQTMLPPMSPAGIPAPGAGGDGTGEGGKPAPSPASAQQPEVPYPSNTAGIVAGA